jgi:hypothetical protein
MYLIITNSHENEYPTADALDQNRIIQAFIAS